MITLNILNTGELLKSFLQIIYHHLKLLKKLFIVYIIYIIKMCIIVILGFIISTKYFKIDRFELVNNNVNLHINLIP